MSNDRSDHAKGGSYEIDKDGNRRLAERTTQLDDPEHPVNKPKPEASAKAPAKGKGK